LRIRNCCPQPSGVTQAYRSGAAQLFLSQGQRDDEELNMDRENAQRRSSAALEQQVRFSRALQQTSLTLALAPRAGELGRC